MIKGLSLAKYAFHAALLGATAALVACDSSNRVSVEAVPLQDPVAIQMHHIQDVLEEEGFEIDRMDFRNRVLTTLPQRIPVLVDTLRFSQVPLGQVSQGAFTGLQRTVRIAHDDTNGWGAEVILLRPHSSVKQLTHSSSQRRVSRLEAVPDELAERGLAANDWQPVKRDIRMEQRLESLFRTTPTVN